MTTTNEFYKTSGLNVEIYDAMTNQAWSVRSGDVDFFVDLARSKGGRVLDLCCGTGRVSLPLAQAGCEVTGIDASEAMLSVAKAKRSALTAEAAARATFQQGDLRDLQLDQTYRVAFITFRSFQILATPEEQRACLQRIRQHLDPDGILVINIFDPRYDRLFPGHQEDTTPPREVLHPVTGNLVQVKPLFRINDPVKQIMSETWTFTEIGKDGAPLRTESVSLSLRWTFRYEMRHLAELAGYHVEAEYGNFRKEPPAYGGEQVWVLRPR